jgi:uncharacterized membrane protein
MDRWTDERVDRLIGHLLRAGVLISAAVVIAGGCVYLARHGQEPPDRRTFHGEPAELSHPLSIVRAALAGDDRGVIALGLLLLIATPVARVALAAYGFLREHDRLYTAVAMFVLIVLLVSLALPY